MKLNRTAQRTIEILRLIAASPEPVTLDGICGALTLPKTSAYDIVTTLAALDMLQVERGQRQRYSIGLGAYQIGITYTNRLDLLSVAEPELKAFARQVGKTVFFGVCADHEVVYICKAEPENPIITTSTVGTKNPVYCTSLGKAILAFSDEQRREEILSGVFLDRKTDRTITDRGVLMAQLEETRARGYALDERELEEHMECAGAPVFGADGLVVGAISASGLYKPTEDYHRLGRLIAAKAAEISRLLGYAGETAPATQQG